MLTFFGAPRRLCDGLSRRDFLKVGALGVGGLTLADLLRLRAQGAAQPSSSAKAIVRPVRTPCPISERCATTVTVPSASIRT